MRPGDEGSRPAAPADATAPPVQPDPAAWEGLLDPAAAEWLEDVDRAVAAGGPQPSDIARWRRRLDASVVARGIELVRARRSLAGRTPHAGRMLADLAGAAMASDAATAAAKAARIAAIAPREVWDLACGIGGDAVHLATIDSLRRLVLVDRDAERLAMAAHNVRLVAPHLELITHAGDAERWAPTAADGLVVHVDPARREEGGRRSHDMDALQPSPEELALIIDRGGDVGLKLGPGVDPAAVPRATSASLEYIARDRTLVQAMAWYGRLADPPGTVRATIVPAGHTLAGAADPSMDPSVLAPPPPRADLWRDEPPAFLLVPHPAAERARLVSAALRAAAVPLDGIRPLAAGLGVLAAPRDPGSPWLEAIPIVAVMAWRPKRVRARLAELGTGEVVVRTRGGAVDPDLVARRLRGPSGPRRSVSILRLGRDVVAFLGDALT